MDNGVDTKQNYVNFYFYNQSQYRISKVTTIYNVPFLQTEPCETQTFPAEGGGTPISNTSLIWPVFVKIWPHFTRHFDWLPACLGAWQPRSCH